MSTGPNLCLACQSKTINPKFCSSSCNASYNNKNRTKKTYYCQNCNIFLRNGWKGNSKYCESCRTNPNINKNYSDWSTMTLGEFKNKFKTNYQFHARIRALARVQCEKTVCKICSYSKYVEVCHIKPISDFKSDDSVADINSKSNLVCLCPNCHWEFDNGLIKLK